MSRMRSRLSLVLLSVIVLPATLVQAQSDGNSRMSVTVSFGAGLNTAQPGNPANHHILPKTIEIKAGGVVNFAVGGFHQIIVYRPGVGVNDIVAPAFPPNLFMNYNLATAYYVGINPDDANAATDPAPSDVFNGLNRLESVSFPEPGVYLVICNVTPHFLDGMYAYVRVSN